MKIKIARPEDPELAALWDEAKRAVESRDCCVGDVTRCRCRARGGWTGETQQADEEPES